MNRRMAARFPDRRCALIVLNAFVALTSIGCGLGLVVGAVPFPRTWLQGTPWSDYTLPGLVMALIVGGSALIAASTLLTQGARAVHLSALAGVLLLLFEVAEFALLDRNIGYWLVLAVPLQVSYSLIGLALVRLALVTPLSTSLRSVARHRSVE